MNAILDNKKSSIQSYLVLLRYNPSNESCRHLHRKLAMHATVVSGASAPILVAAILFFVIAAVQDMSVQVQARDHFPPQFRDTLSSRYAMDTFVWMPSIVPVTIRRQYFSSLICASVSMGLFGFFLLAQGEKVGALLFGGVFLMSVVHTTMRWIKYRELL